MTRLWLDLRYAARMLRKNAGFSVLAIVMLALGIASNTVIFSFFDAYLFRPLPGIEEPGRVVRVGSITSEGHFGGVRYPTYLYFRDDNQAFDGLTAFSAVLIAVSTDHGARNTLGALVSGNYFAVLRVRAIRGRTIEPSDDSPGAAPVAVISHQLWTGYFGADAGVIGKTIKLNRSRFTIIGVAPQPFHGNAVEESTDVWVPLSAQKLAWPIAGDLFQENSRPWLWLAGRLKPGVDLKQAEAHINVLAHQLQQRDDLLKWGMLMLPGLGLHPRTYASTKALFLMLLGAVGMVLLIACANVAVLLLAKAASRTREIAVRLAVGASRWELVRQFLTESMLLALLAGAAGLALAYVSVGFVARLLPPHTDPVPIDFHPDTRALLFTLLVSLGTAVVYGLAPAIRTTRPDLANALRGSAGSTGPTSRFQHGLVVLQVALCMVLLVGAGLLIRTLRNYSNVNPGYDADRVLAIGIGLERQGYDAHFARQFYPQVLKSVGALPGVQAVSLAANAATHGYADFVAIGQSGVNSGRVQVGLDVISLGYFRTLGLKLLQGRNFTAADREGAPGAAIVNEAMARRFWPNSNAIGAPLRMQEREGPERVLQIVGVVGNVRAHLHDGEFDTSSDEPLVYVPWEQDFQRSMCVLVRTASRPQDVRVSILREIRSLDPELWVPLPVSLGERMALTHWRHRFAGILLGAFSLLALLMAASGLYGVLAYMVARRTREIGIRMALGARPGRVLREVTASGLQLAGTGILFGIAGGLAVTRLLSSWLFGVTAADPAIYVALAFFLATVGLLASYIPARRAARVDPAIALRHE